MYAVIFRAEIGEIDDDYSKMASRARDLAVNKYGCIDFTAVTEGNQEIAISYWPTKKHISAWTNDPIHKKAQESGRSKWYKSYNVQLVEIISEYKKDS
jgi:heme-degrading monooxygenase HmoA